MSAVTLPRTLATGFVIAAIAAVLVTGGRLGSDEPLPSPLTSPTTIETAAHATEAPTGVASETPVAAKVRELNAMSETYRNTTLLIAIRDSGFVCHELLRVYGALDDAPKWLASCSEMLSYTISVASNGTLRVEPMMQYFDGPVQSIQLNEDPARPRVQPR